MAKKKPLPPRRKRMKRSARLQSAKNWLLTYSGKDPVRGYAKWYAIDPICAIIELRLLGIPIPEKRWEQALKTQETKTAANQKQKKRKQQEEIDSSLIESDDTFEFIVGYTPAGFPYGIEWEDP